MPSDRVGGSMAYSNSGSGPAPGVAVNLGGVGGALTTNGASGGTVGVQLTGVFALVVLGLLIWAHHALK